MKTVTDWTRLGHAVRVIFDGPFRGSEAIERGQITRGRLAGPGYQRIFADVYAPAGLALDLRVRSLAAYLLVGGQRGVLAGYSAALLLGADCAPIGAPAEVLVGRNTRRCPGLLVRYGVPRAGDVVQAAGCVVTSARCTAWDLCRRLPLVDGVVALDALARAGRFAPAELLARRAAEPGARGCRRLDRVVALADPRAESPPETRLRLQLHRAGLPPPEVQYEVLDEYGFVLARVDLAYPAALLAIEYDGSLHYTRYRGEQDRQRDAVLAGHGWQTLRLGRDDIGAAQTAGQVRRILAARGLLTEFNRTQAIS
ncbi:MAG: endonuclease domain-containing protein [Pseudonocardia sp.]